MQKALAMVSIIIVLSVMAGCGNEKNENQVDFQGIILDMHESSISVGTDDVNPEASYPVYEVFVDDHTVITREAEEFSELKVDQHVEIFVKDSGSNQAIDNKAAKKIIVGG